MIMARNTLILCLVLSGCGAATDCDDANAMYITADESAARLHCQPPTRNECTMIPNDDANIALCYRKLAVSDSCATLEMWVNLCLGE